MSNPPLSLACLALGSNIGNARMHFNAALEDLSTTGNILSQSKLYRCKAVGDTEQADYWNAVILLETKLSVRELLKLTQNIEIQCGRTSKGDLAARTLDLDIIFYDELILDEPDLQIPHPRAHERDFVLLPLSEIKPSWMHPVLGMSASKLMEQLSEQTFLGETLEFE